ncbi:thermonuclease family protein [Candidatus Gracilibacteria bacterium]|nr:thermonuclease family protein [Candidatus Gracilibacteria bacterium]
MKNKASKNFTIQLLCGTLLIVTTLSLHFSKKAEGASSLWQKGNVRRVLDSNHLLLADGTKIKLAGITTPDIFFPQKSEECLSRFIFHSLQELIEGKEIQWKKTEEFQKNFFRGFVKIGKIDISLFLLEHGFAKTDSFSDLPTSYASAQKEAQSNKSGIWGTCTKGNLKKSLHAKGYFGKKFREKYAHFLAPISVGVVEKVTDGQSFFLTNGLAVQMIGLEVPSPADERVGFGCFGQASKRHLEELILGKKVYLKKDISQFNEEKKLLRYVFLPLGGKRNPEIFINKRMISDGYAKHFRNQKDTLFKKEFEKIQQEVYTTPLGAWTYCINKILNK